MIPTPTPPLGRLQVIGELAELLARAYLRLRAGKRPAKAHNSPETRGNRPRAGLDVLGEPSDESCLVNNRRTP